MSHVCLVLSCLSLSLSPIAGLRFALRLRLVLRLSCLGLSLSLSPIAGLRFALRLRLVLRLSCLVLS